MVDVLPDAVAMRWLKYYASKNMWRVAPWMDLDDMIQLGYEAYYETRSRYPTATEPRHIQSLFQLVFRSKIENLVRGYTKQLDDANTEYVERHDSMDFLSVPQGDFHALVIKAPEKIRAALNILVKEPEELTKPYARDDRGRRETLNDRLCGLLGLDPDTIDLVKMTRNYFQGARSAA